MADALTEESMAEPTPRWVKVFAAITILVFVAFVALHLGGGGPRLH